MLKRISYIITYLKNLMLFFYFSIKVIIVNLNKGNNLISTLVLKQIYFTGVKALTLISITGIIVSGIIIIQIFHILPTISKVDDIISIITVAIFREVAPIVTAFILISRSGSAIATYVGNARVNQEIEAIEILGIPPLHYLVSPIMISSIISNIILTLYFTFISLFGGIIILSLIRDVSVISVLFKVFKYIVIQDIVLVLLKSTLFGIIIATISCYAGFNVVRSINEVPKATTHSVVSSIIIVFIINFIITALSVLKFV